MDYLRDTCGVVVRFWGMSADKELPQLSAEAASRLHTAVEEIVKPLEAQPPKKMDGHHVGALYMQVLTPYCCASRNPLHTSNKSLTDLLRRLGAAILNWHRTHGSHAQRRAMRSVL